MSSALIKEPYLGVDTGFDDYDLGSPAPPKNISRPDRTMSPEQALWLAVLHQAWKDALSLPREVLLNPNDGSRWLGDDWEKWRAYRWIVDQHPYFKMACHLAGYDPDDVSERVYKAVTGRKRRRPKLVHAAPVG